MNWNRFAAAVAGVCLGCGLAAGVSQAQARQTLVYNLQTEPETLDPAKATGIPEADVILNCMDGLVSNDADGRAIPALAQSWEITSDGLTYTFHLREAKWSNGDPVAARDFVESWIRVLAPETAAEYASQLYYIAGARAFNEGRTSDSSTVAIRALDDRTLRVVLTDPAPYFLSMLAHTVFMPFHRKTAALTPREWRIDPPAYLCTGPFRLWKWESQSRIVLERNPLYWDAKSVALDELVMMMIPIESSAWAAFESGQLDLAGRPPLSVVKRLKAENRIRFAPTIGCYYVNFNCKAKPFDDPRVRRALALAIDRRLITQFITQSSEKPALALVPPGIKDADGKRDFRDEGGDLFKDAHYDEARRLLAEAGYPSGRGLPAIGFLFNTAETHKDIATEMQHRWKKELGVEVELQNTEWKVYLRRLRAGEYQMGRGGWIGDFLDPMTFLDTFTTESGNNNPHWSNKAYDGSIAQAKKELDPVKRMKTLHEAEAILIQDMPLAPIYFYTRPYLEKPGVRGIVRTPLGTTYFKEATRPSA